MKNLRNIVVFLLLLCGAATASAQSQEEEKTDGKGLNVVIFGDSNTWLGGDQCNKEKGWNKWFKDLFQPESCISYARSGATWTNTAATKRNTKENIGILGNDNVIYNQVNRLMEAYDAGNQVAPDLILIAAGTNDLWFQNERPGLYGETLYQEACDSFLNITPPSEILSLEDCMHHSIWRLQRAFCKAKIVVLTPLQTTQVSQQRIHDIGDRMEQICREMENVFVIRWDKSGIIDSDKERAKKLYTYDGTHTSAAGAKRNAEFVVKELREIFK